MPTTRGAETDHNPGRRTDNAMKSNFEKLCKWLDEQTKLLTASKLHAKMCSFAEKDQNAYSLKWMKKQLEQHFAPFFKTVNENFSRTRFKASIIGSMYFKGNETEQCYTSSVIWVRCSNRPCYWFKIAIDRNFKVGICYLL